MTQAQYDTAKDLVLDLLGWGVPPEYLVDCGLSRPIVFYVFTELNLRLPTNLDIAGLAPYRPDKLHSAQQPGPTMISLQQPQPSSSGHPETDLAGILRRATAHSTKLADQDNSKSRITIPPSASGSTLPPPARTSSSPSIPPGLSLHDIEQQRRQELLARKAVQASRKSKTAVVEGAPASSPRKMAAKAESIDQDVEMSSDIPEVSVEDFLKSLGHDSPERGRNNASEGSNVQSTDAFMDIDETIPGLVIQEPGSAVSGSELSGSSSLASVSTTLTSVTHDSGSSANLETPPLTSTSEHTLPVSRRGTKRPVASDFVDLEPARPSSAQAHVNGGPQSTTVKKTGSFASVSGMRRCVIDLSDSDDDGSRVTWRGGGGGGGRSSSSSSGPNGRGTPPHPVAVASAGTKSPGALVEKEEEIRKMRELIAQRERNRFKKLAMVRGIFDVCLGALTLILWCRRVGLRILP